MLLHFLVPGLLSVGGSACCLWRIKTPPHPSWQDGLLSMFFLFWYFYSLIVSSISSVILHCLTLLHCLYITSPCSPLLLFFVYLLPPKTNPKQNPRRGLRHPPVHSSSCVWSVSDSFHAVRSQVESLLSRCPCATNKNTPGLLQFLLPQHGSDTLGALTLLPAPLTWQPWRKWFWSRVKKAFNRNLHLFPRSMFPWRRSPASGIHVLISHSNWASPWR